MFMFSTYISLPGFAFLVIYRKKQQHFSYKFPSSQFFIMKNIEKPSKTLGFGLSLLSFQQRLTGLLPTSRWFDHVSGLAERGDTAEVGLGDDGGGFSPRGSHQKSWEFPLGDDFEANNLAILCGIGDGSWQY